MTTQEFLTGNREYILRMLNAEFGFKKVEFKVVVKMYFEFVMNSNYAGMFTRIEKVDFKKAINNSITDFKSETDFAVNSNALADFRELQLAQEQSNFKLK